MELADSDTIRSMPCITAFDAGKKKINASKAFSERQPAIPEARASSRVGCFLAGGRYPAMQDAGAPIPNVESRGGGSPYFRPANSQQRCGPRGKTGLHVPAVCHGSVPAVLPSRLEGINYGHIEAGHQVSSHTGVRQESASFDRSGSIMAHLRWFLNAVFKLAMSDGLMLNNPAAELRILGKSVNRAGRCGL